MKKVIVIVLMICATSAVFAQQGFLKGKISDGANGEGLFGATVTKQGTTQGSVADFDGNYSVSLEAGVHTIVVQSVAFQSQVFEGIEIKEGETTILDVTLLEDVQQLESVVVTATQIRDNEVALMAVQKKSVNTVDGISAAAFKKLGDGDLGTAMKRVTGVSVQGGKYIYVRGLGDRYTKTTMNGMTIPGLDPDRNAVQMDIFPTSMIENVVVYKTFTPDLQADFTGGVVNVESKKFPEEKSTNISFGLGFNPAMHLRKDYLSYEGGKTDFLGFDDGTRSLPFSKYDEIPYIKASNGEVAESYTKSFTPTLSAQEQMNFMNTNFSISHGNQVDLSRATVGYNAIFNYQNNTEFYDEVQQGEYRIDEESDINVLNATKTRIGSLGKNEVQWSALLAGAVKFDKSSYSATFMRTQNGVSSAMQRTSANQDSNPSILQEDILTYTQRSISNLMLSGKHTVNVWDLSWKASLNKSNITDPDMRDTRLEVRDEGGFGLNVGVGAGVDRYFRELNEGNQSVKFDASRPFGADNKMKFGGISTFKNRQFELNQYYFRNFGDKEITGVADDLLSNDNIWNPTTDEGIYVRGIFDPANQYDAKMKVHALYAMTELELIENLKFVGGLRMEVAKMNYTGQDQSNNVLTDSLVLNELNVLPSMNMIYSLNENMNLRGSFNQTLARPTFKEKSNVQIYDPISARTFIGNLELNQTYINNYDLRWEFFYSRSEMVSVSAFYKQFDGHIELTSFTTAPDQVTPRNAGHSTVAGIELEFRKDLNESISFGMNASFVQSKVDMESIQVQTIEDQNGEPMSERTLRQNNARDGETIDRYRPMTGQAPYILNGFVNVKTADQSLNASLSYNVQGESLNTVGSGQTLDIYNKEFHSLNLNVSKKLGPLGMSKVTVGVDNILGAKRQLIFKSYQSDEKIFSLFEPGRTFSIKYAYSF